MPPLRLQLSTTAEVPAMHEGTLADCWFSTAIIGAVLMHVDPLCKIDLLRSNRRGKWVGTCDFAITWGDPEKRRVIK